MLQTIHLAERLLNKLSKTPSNDMRNPVQGTFLIRVFIDRDQLDTPININKYFQRLSEFNFGHLDEALTRVAQSKRFLEEGHFNVFVYIIGKA